MEKKSCVTSFRAISLCDGVCCRDNSNTRVLKESRDKSHVPVKIRKSGQSASISLRSERLCTRQALWMGDEHQLKEEAMAENQIAQVIAFICGVIVVILMIMALASTDWLMAKDWRQGLFMHCITQDADDPLPFNINDAPGHCWPARDVAYIKAAAGLCVITLLTDVVASLLTGLGLRSKDHRTKYKFYKVAVYVMVLSLISILIALVIYPVCFAAEFNKSNRSKWEFGWAYGVGWGAAIFLFGGVILLLCDKESEEIYYKERKIVHDTDSRA